MSQAEPKIEGDKLVIIAGGKTLNVPLVPEYVFRMNMSEREKVNRPTVPFFAPEN